VNVLPKPRPADVVMRSIARGLRGAFGWMMRETKTPKTQGVRPVR
jgi:hypothetical protein